MGNRREILQEFQNCREPSRLTVVQGGNSGGQQRPEDSGTFPDERNPHETSSQTPQIRLEVRPEDAPAPDGTSDGSTTSVDVTRPAPQGHVENEGHSAPKRRSADADRAPAKRGRRAKKWLIRVNAINPERHPEFLGYSGHPYAGMKADERIEAITTFCARLWARTCEEMSRNAHVQAKAA